MQQVWPWHCYFPLLAAAVRRLQLRHSHTGFRPDASATISANCPSFYVFVPSSANRTQPAPAILLIHGGGGKGPDLVNFWRSFAEQMGIILVGPTLPLGGNFETAVAPQLYPLIMDAVRNEWNVDANRIYLFGVSAGGYTVFDAGMFDSTVFRCWRCICRGLETEI